MTTEAAGASEELVLVLTTVPDQKTGDELVRALVAERLAACGSLLPGLTSIYRWKGSVESSAELLVLLKTPAARAPALFRRVAELHPYEVPELVALPTHAVSEAYSRWVRDETIEVIA